MAVLDLATVEGYRDDERIELYIPYAQRELGSYVKERFNARFKTDQKKKRWVIEFRFAKAGAEEIIAAIEDKLFDMAPPYWREAVANLSRYACSSTRYEVRFAAGGARIMLPGGHPLHYHLERMCGQKPDRDVWRIPADRVKPKELAAMLARIQREDGEVFRDAVEPYEGRRIVGGLIIPWSQAPRFNLAPGRVVFADHAFLAVADPQVVRMHIAAWPLVVRETAPSEGAIRTTLDYMDAERGSRAVGKLMSLPRGDRPALLDAVHADGKWKARSP